MTPPETQNINPIKDPPSIDPPKLLRQTLWVWFLTMLAIRIVHELQQIPFFKEYTMVATAILLIYVPIWILYRRREKIAFIERSFKYFFNSLFWFTALSVVIFPILEIGNRYYQEIFFGLHYVGGHYKGLAKFALFHLILVAIPEEFFYRGYLQPQLNRIYGRPWKFLGARFGWSLVITSFLFALSHSLIQLHWWHFSIFFPSLVFGWLREKTGAITASALFHALSNVYSYWVVLNYRG